jgi:hypothetical protein
MNAKTEIPELSHYEGSWIVVSPQGDIRELYERRNVEKAVAAGWTVTTIGAYLSSFNKMSVQS